METPNTEAGRMTERIMAEVTAKTKHSVTASPQLPTWIYNALYSAVLKELQKRPELNK